MGKIEERESLKFVNKRLIIFISLFIYFVLSTLKQSIKKPIAFTLLNWIWVTKFGKGCIG